MRHQHQNPEVALFNVDNFKELPTCGIEDVDRAVFDLFDKVLPMNLEVDGEVKRIPVIYASGERAVILSKRKPLRDKAGALILPLISIMRSGIEQDPDGYGLSPNTSEIVIKKKISRANLEYKRAINENNLQSQDYVLSGSAVGNRFSTREHTPASGSPSLSKSTKNIYETYTMPAPRFFQCTYEITFWVHYQQHINSIFEAIMSSYITPARQFMITSDKGYTFTSILEKGFSDAANMEDYTEAERLVKASVNLRVNGYVINAQGPGLMPQIKRYVSSPRIVFDITQGTVPNGTKEESNLQSGDAQKYIRSHYDHEDTPLPGSMFSRDDETSSTLAKDKEETADILLGKTVKTAGGELLILDEDPITGAQVEKKYIIKDSNHRKGETVLREVKILG